MTGRDSTELLAALREYRQARLAFLNALDLPSSMRDPLSEFAEQLVEALVGGTRASNRVQAGWDLMDNAGRRVQVKYLANPAGAWVNEHQVRNEGCDRWALVVFEALDPIGVCIFDTARLADTAIALGKRHPGTDSRIELTPANIRALLAESERFLPVGVEVIPLAERAS